MTVRAGLPTRHALLSGDGSWSGAALDGLSVQADGRVELLWVPGVAEPWIGVPAWAEPSGLAVDRDCGLFVSDAVARRLVRRDLSCGAQNVLQKVSWRPAGLCVGPNGWLFVADPQGGRVLVYSLPELTLRDEWTAGLDAPVGLAADGERGVFVLDRGAGRVARFHPWGDRDEVVSKRLATASAPRALTTAADGTLYVADAAASAVLQFGPDGTAAGAPLAGGAVAQALAVGGDILYVADADDGRVRLVGRDDRRPQGFVDGFLGPVSALAADADGRLHIKTGGNDVVVVAQPLAARVPRGSLTAGPFDAGEEDAWFRLAVDAAVPSEAGIRVETAVAADPGGVPDWRTAAARDSLLDGDRFLRVRVTLERGGSATSPSVTEVRAETEGDSYLSHLPAVYSRDSASADLLQRLLALAKARLGDLESALEQMPRTIDPQTAPAELLRRLASWEAFDIPPQLATAERAGELRALLAELPELEQRRGTPAGIARLAEIYAGVSPTLVEDFATRRIWMLGATSALGFDTALPADALDGIVLGASVAGASGPEDPALWGSALFDATAHRFVALAPAAAVRGDEGRRLLHRVLEAEKPAHTEYHLCLFDARFRVGVQAHVGLDAIVAGAGPALELGGGTQLGHDSRLADEPAGAAGAVGRRGRLGLDTRVG